MEVYISLPLHNMKVNIVYEVALRNMCDYEYVLNGNVYL